MSGLVLFQIIYGAGHSTLRKSPSP